MWDFDFLMFARKSNIKAEGFLVCVCASDVALSFFEAFHTVLVVLFPVLGGLITLHFQPFHISPLETHFATLLVFTVATIVYGIAYVLITLQPPDSWVPCHIQVHLSSFWNHCYCATCLNNYSSPLAIHCKFMVNPDRRGSEFVQTNLSTSLLHSYFSIQTQYLACLERFVN